MILIQGALFKCLVLSDQQSKIQFTITHDNEKQQILTDML